MDDADRDGEGRLPAPDVRSATLSRWLSSPVGRQRAIHLLADEPEERARIEQLASAAESLPTASLLETGGALAGSGWERIADRLFGPSLVAGQKLSRYVLLEQVGAGGMGVVWSAWDPELDRKVAVKVLFPVAGGDRSDERQRLLGEARALAALSHPNVVAVYDAGEVDGRVFLAMEFVEGTDLHDWALATPRNWREIVAVFVAAGRGLAAAHAAGLVHHDFKPQNVLIGADGRIRVADFGLARAAADADAAGGEPLPAAIAGTPAYMAPEQIEGREFDPRGDQFGFCVALWESLFEQRPYAGSTFEEMLETYQGETAPAAPESRVPRRITRLLLRGLALDPNARWSSMPELLDTLERASSPRTGRWLSVAAVGAAAVVATALFLRASATEVCQGLSQPLLEVWGSQRQATLAARFEAAGLGPEAPARARTFDALHGWAATWLDERQLACAAAHQAGDLSPEVADLRVACFGRRLRELDALVSVLSDAGSDALLDAPKAALALESSILCADAELLAAPTRPPVDPASVALLAQLEGSVARGKALRDSGQLDDGLVEIEAALGAATELDYLPIRSELLHLQSDLLERIAEFDRAEASSFAAWELAERAGHEEIVIRTLSLLTFLDGNDRTRFDASRRWSALAEARLSRLVGGAPHLAAQLANDSGAALQAEGRLDEALVANRRALELRQGLYGRDSVEAAKSWNNLGSILYSQGRFEEALTDYRRASELMEARLGSDHPDLSMTLSNVGAALTSLRRADDARVVLQRAFEIRTQRFGVGSVWWAIAQLNLGFADLIDRPRAALPHFEDAREVLVAHGLEAHPFFAYALGGIARTRLELGDSRGSLPLFEQSLEIARAGGLPPSDTADLRFGHARATWEVAGATSDAVERATTLLGELHGSATSDSFLIQEIESWLAERAPRV